LVTSDPRKTYTPEPTTARIATSARPRRRVSVPLRRPIQPAATAARIVPRYTYADASRITPIDPATTATAVRRLGTASAIAAKPIARAAPVNDPKS
jgi:hypothetical protein